MKMLTVLTSVAAALLMVASPVLGQSVVLPAGTAVAVKTIDPIKSQGGTAFLEYRATVDDAVVVGGRTVIPGGSPAFLRVVEVHQSGAVRGETSITIVLAGVVVNGQRFVLNSSALSVASSSQAVKVAKAGALGALAGIMVSKGVGGSAGTGARIGGALFAAVAMGTQKVSIKSEARLSFTLASGTSFTRGEAPDPSIRKALVGIHDEMVRRLAAVDLEWLDQWLDPSWQWVINGARSPRAAALKKLKPVELVSVLALGDPDLRTEGSRYVLNGTESYQYRKGRKVESRYRRYASVFVQRDGRWVCVLSEVLEAKN